MVRVALLASATAAALVWTPGAGHAETPQPGGTLTFAVPAEPPNYDCHANVSFAFVHPARPHYSTLLEFDPENFPELRGNLAKSWTVSDDALTYTFQLRENVKFHDGSHLTAADVKASYDRLRNPPDGVSSVRQADFADIAAIETPDDATVVFKLSAPDAAMLANFASPWNCIYSAAKLAEDPKFPEQNILGTGPFEFVEHVAGSHWIGKRFEDYFEPDKPYLDGYRAVFISGAAMVNALQGGQVLAEFRGQSPADRDKLVNALGDRAVVQESTWNCLLQVTFNTESPPFDDVRVRRALSLAIDRWQGSEALSKIAIVRSVGGLLRPGYEFAASEAELMTLPGYSKDVEASREEAKRLLDEAGQRNLSFKFTNRNVPQPYTPLGVFLIDQWRQIGIDVEHEQLETKLWLAALESGNYQVAMDFNCGYMDEPSLQLSKYLSPDHNPGNYTRKDDPVLDQLYEQQKRTTDFDERHHLVREFEERVLTEAYSVPTLWWHRIVVHWDQLKGWHVTPSHYLNQDLADVWLDD